MARGIIDCTGKRINIGDKVKTPGGAVIMVCGGFVNDEKLWNAEKCKLVPPHTPLTSATSSVSTVSTDALDNFSEGEGTDCVVWGS